jgi:hypothetical protein
VERVALDADMVDVFQHGSVVSVRPRHRRPERKIAERKPPA